MTSLGLSQRQYQKKTATNRLGLWLFFISDSFMFGGLIISRFYLLGDQKLDLNQFLGLMVTAILLTSSFFMNRAEVMVSQGNRKGFIRSLIITILLGITFLVGVIGVEWADAPFGPADGAQGAVFYMLTGMHAFHVLTGILFLLVTLRNGLKNKFSSEKHYMVEAAANYWHFVDVVWIIVYPVLYLMGTF
ncbi:MAG: cytochrome oxidase subunit III [Chloroflexi bacterium 44-23]|nr:MAG: cytochrome oxidase subunit III [Chloroflexi bacterium 44-23]